MLARILSFLGGLTFLGNGLTVLADGSCKSISFSGARAIVATCFTDGSGAFPAKFAGFLMLVAGTLLVAFGAMPYFAKRGLKNTSSEHKGSVLMNLPVPSVEDISSSGKTDDVHSTSKTARISLFVLLAVPLWSMLAYVQEYGISFIGFPEPRRLLPLFLSLIFLYIYLTATKKSNSYFTEAKLAQNFILQVSLLIALLYKAFSIDNFGAYLVGESSFSVSNPVWRIIDPSGILMVIFHAQRGWGSTGYRMQESFPGVIEAICLTTILVISITTLKKQAFSIFSRNWWKVFWSLIKPKSSQRPYVIAALTLMLICNVVSVRLDEFNSFSGTMGLSEDTMNRFSESGIPLATSSAINPSGSYEAKLKQLGDDYYKELYERRGWVENENTSIFYPSLRAFKVAYLKHIDAWLKYINATAQQGSAGFVQRNPEISATWAEVTSREKYLPPMFTSDYERSNWSDFFKKKS